MSIIQEKVGYFLDNPPSSDELKGVVTVYEQRDTSVPRKHRADYRDRDNWGTTRTRNIHRVVYSFNSRGHIYGA